MQQYTISFPKTLWYFGVGKEKADTKILLKIIPTDKLELIQNGKMELVLNVINECDFH